MSKSIEDLITIFQTEGSELDTMVGMMCKGLFNFTPDYSPESLGKLEHGIINVYPTGVQMSTTLVPIGLYLGEVLVRNIPGAKWNAKGAQYIDEIKIEISGAGEVNGEAYPFVRADKFVNKDRTDGFEVYYRMLNQMALGLMDAVTESGQEGQWIDMGNGDKMRYFGSEKDYYDAQS